MLDFEKARPLRNFCSDVGISRHTAWRQIREGKLKAVKRGARVFIPDDAAAAWFETGRVLPRTERAAAVPLPASPRAVTVPPPDARAALFRGGLATLRSLTGKPEAGCRALIGRLLRASRDDAAVVNAALAEAASLRPADPVAWLTAAITRRGPRNGFIAVAQGLASQAPPPANPFLALPEPHHGR